MTTHLDYDRLTTEQRTRKAAIQAVARDHRARGIYDSIGGGAKTGMERGFYADTWEAAQ